MGTWFVDVDASTLVGNVSADSASSERAVMKSYRSLHGASHDLLVGMQQGSSSWLEPFFENYAHLAVKVCLHPRYQRASSTSPRVRCLQLLLEFAVS